MKPVRERSRKPSGDARESLPFRAVSSQNVSNSNAVLCSTTVVDNNVPHYWRVIKYVIGASAAAVLIVDGKIEDVYIGAYTISPTTRPLLIATEGFNTGARTFNGNLDDLAIYKA